MSSVVMSVDRLVLTPGGGLCLLLALPGLEPIVRTSGECLEILLTSVWSAFKLCAIVVRLFVTKGSVSINEFKLKISHVAEKCFFPTVLCYFIYFNNNLFEKS